MDAAQIATAAAQGFGLFQCEECADAVQQALTAAGIKGERIELRSDKGRQFMACLSYTPPWVWLSCASIRFEELSCFQFPHS